MENEKQLPPLVVEQSHSSSSSSPSGTHGSIETLLVVLAVITILGVVAGIIARLCGGRHFSGNGEDDIEGWVERKCRSCIDGGVPNTTSTQEEEAKISTPAPAPAPTTVEEAKK